MYVTHPQYRFPNYFYFSDYQERLKREDAAATVIQRSYRMHLRRMFAKAFRQRIIAHRLYMHR